ncbi:MAG: hypothetical protein ACRDPM_14695, partial [Solirubrobacteraceae bacterium]
MGVAVVLQIGDLGHLRALRHLVGHGALDEGLVAHPLLIAPDLLVEWERRLDDFDGRGWHNHVEPFAEPSVEYVGLKRTGNADTDYVVVKIDARVKDYVVDRSGRQLRRT